MVRRFGPAHLLTVILVVVLTACSGGSDTSSTTTTTSGPPPPKPELPAENISFYYQRIRAGEDLSKLGRVQLVVASRINRASAARAIHAIGAKAYRYVQTYWFPEGRTYDDVDIAEHPDWAYCSSGDTPLVGRTDSAGTDWVFLDMNERAVRNHFVEKLTELERQGWDGVFFDRGLAAMTGVDNPPAGIWNRESTCTDDPIADGATAADAFVNMTSAVAEAGLELIVNYGLSPFDQRNAMRPDPEDSRCRPMVSRCRILDDAWEHATWILDEAIAHEKAKDWRFDYAANQRNETDPRHGGKVIGLLTEATLGGDYSRRNVFYEWSRAKLFAIPLGVGTGDDGCPGSREGDICNRQGTFPELASVTFGPAAAPAPRKQDCADGSNDRCVWSRQYEWGMSVVNVRPTTVEDVELPLGTQGCRYVRDVWSGRPLARNRCVTSVTLDLPAWSGRPLEYGSTPW